MYLYDCRSVYAILQGYFVKSIKADACDALVFKRDNGTLNWKRT